uniref:Palmitoyltransferase n=1 Tax=Sus scrofa TaxID=9823 RepID=A0A8D0NK05_PIG
MKCYLFLFTRKGRCLPCGFPSVLCYVCMVLLDDNFHISRFPLQRVLLVQFREGTLREGVQPGKTTGDSEKSGEGLACLHHVGDTEVNNCVGFSNYKFFLLFLLYSLLYCLFVATTVLQYFIKFWTNELSDTRAKFHVLFLFFVSTMFFISVLSLLSYHCWLVGKNRTTIESFRAPTFSYGPDGNGFSLGCSKNWRQVFGDEKKYWLLPVFSSQGDGCSFPTRLVGTDPEQASVSNQSESGRSIGSNQPFPIKPLSESKNRLLDSESQWLEDGAEEGVVRPGL